MAIKDKQIKVKQNMLEGSANPKLIYSDGSVFNLPEPWGENREDLRVYDFEEVSQDSFRSEGNQDVKVGTAFVFVGSIHWLRQTKLVLKALQKAAADQYIWLVLNTDKPDIKYKCRVKVKYRFTKGLYGIGYDIVATFRGVEYLDEPGYGDLELTGYGTDYGNKVGNQSP